MCKRFSFPQTDSNKQINNSINCAYIKWNQSELTCLYPNNPKQIKRHHGSHNKRGLTLYPFPTA